LSKKYFSTEAIFDPDVVEVGFENLLSKSGEGIAKLTKSEKF